MEYLWIALLGLAIGAAAMFTMPGRDPGGCVVTMIIGLAGSFIGGFLARLLHISTSSDAAWFIASVIGAIILLVLYRSVLGKRNAP